MSWIDLLRRLGRWLLGLPAPLSWALPLAWAGLIWFLSSQHIATPGGDFPLWGFLGNLTHAPLFGLLALFLTAALLKSGSDGDPPDLPRPSTRLVVFVLALVLAYGIVDEWHQSYTSGRHSTGSDVVTDVVGAGCVLWIVCYMAAVRTPGGSSPPGAAAISERGLRLRLAAGVALCMLVAWLGLR